MYDQERPIHAGLGAGLLSAKAQNYTTEPVMPPQPINSKVACLLDVAQSLLSSLSSTADRTLGSIPQPVNGLGKGAEMVSTDRMLDQLMDTLQQVHSTADRLARGL